MGVYLELFDDETLALKASYRDRERVKAVGDCRWSKEVKRWLFPLSHSVVDNIQREFGKIAIEPQIFTRLKLLDSFQTRVQKIKKLRDCNIDQSLVKVPLYPHQRVGIKFAQQFDRCCIFDDMGLMKSLQALFVALWHKSRGEISKCIIVSPKSCKESVWARQVREFTDEKCLVVDGTPAKRNELYERYKTEDILFLVFSYETLRIDFQKLKGMKILNSGSCGVQMAILDEVQKLKNRKAKITRIVKNVQVPFAIGLTGTPIPNTILDLWSPLDILAPSLLASNFRRFSERYLEKARSNNREITGYRDLEELRKKVASVSIRRLKEQVSDLPEMIREDRILTMVDREQKRIYEELRERLFTWIQNMDGEEVRVKVSGILARSIKLSQVADGFLTGDGLRVKWFRSSKVQEIDEILNDYSSAGVVIFTRWLACIDFLFRRYRHKYSALFLDGSVPSRKRVEIIDNFQNGKSQVFISQIVAGGLGISLNRAKIAIFMDKGLVSPGTLSQAESRVHRSGRRGNCVMLSLIVKDTIDERWETLMKAKLELSSQIIPSTLGKEDWLYLLGRQRNEKV